jgi:hypothetical protein
LLDPCFGLSDHRWARRLGQMLELLIGLVLLALICWSQQ